MNTVAQLAIIAVVDCVGNTILDLVQVLVCKGKEVTAHTTHRLGA